MIRNGKSELKKNEYGQIKKESESLERRKT